MAIQILDELHYSSDRKGPWRLYVYEADGLHRGGQWFRRPPLVYADEEITAEEAMNISRWAVLECKEVRVCDGGDMLVFHAQNGKILYPRVGNFWKEITGVDL